MDFSEQFNKSRKISVIDYDLAKTIESGQIFRREKLPEQQGYLVFSRNTYCRVRQDGNVLYLDSFGEPNERYWPFMFAVNEHDDRLEALMSVTPFLREAYDFSKGIRILRQDPWEALISFIVSQNNNIPRIKKCINAVCHSKGRILGYGHYGFPKPEDLRPIALCNCGLGYRERYIYDAASAVANGTLNLTRLHASCSTPMRAMQELIQLRGVGTKVAECTMLFGLMHDNVFPVDVWISRAMKEGNITQLDVEGFGRSAGLVQQHIYYYMLNRR